MITSTVYKTARDEDGNHRSEDEIREVPWVTIAPVVNAIQVLERMVPQGKLLLDRHAHDLRGTRTGAGSLTVHSLGVRVENLHHLGQPEGSSPQAGPRGHPAGPERQDRHRTVSPEPGLAHRPQPRRPGRARDQYGHLRTCVAAGYAARSRDGIHNLLDVETARATINTVADLNAALRTASASAGQPPAGPSTLPPPRPRTPAPSSPARQARQILANPHLAVYDNPHTGDVRIQA
ncbi:hypothetical protein [Streptomyces zagrosensis]|uniref:Uncharacterized protein n=1 Tax=Streptomyces zagrosensis TaxID=1042984 RepID=A0A7W9QHB9_9ACTN|nr:hypothetical protein [Streptomyces zagrosensis]MBB5939222.1 hypothetical protein [Streptomyces zagrosensis]